jgi:hypothetical protein
MGIDVPELTEAPSLPQLASHVWQWYIELVNTTTISYTEVKSWSDMHQINIRSWELSAIMQIEKARKSNG